MACSMSSSERGGVFSRHSRMRGRLSGESQSMTKSIPGRAFGWSQQSTAQSTLAERLLCRSRVWAAEIAKPSVRDLPVPPVEPEHEHQGSETQENRGNTQEFEAHGCAFSLWILSPPSCFRTSGSNPDKPFPC